MTPPGAGSPTILAGAPPGSDAAGRDMAETETTPLLEVARATSGRPRSPGGSVGRTSRA